LGIISFSRKWVLNRDPPGPLPLCLSIRPLLQSLSASLSIGFLDDVTLGGDATSVAKDVDSVRFQGELIGLRLNVSQCELISHSDTPLADNLDAFTSFKPSDPSLLGAPLFGGSAMSTHLESYCTELSRVIDRFPLLPSHCFHPTMHLSCSARVLAQPKLMHNLRCAPCAGHTSLVEFDNRGSSNVESVLYVTLICPVYSKCFKRVSQ